jgi:Arc/MetJ-type ribon-helix-helix transcriptional regulator
MGRKPLPEGARRTVQVSVMFTREEGDGIAKAVASGRFNTSSDVVRHAVQKLLQELEAADGK